MIKEGAGLFPVPGHTEDRPSGCCSPRLAGRSAVQILPFNANQMKNLQRRDAQLRQILRHAANFMEPTKKAS
jgi:hypothetical protein